MAFHRNFAEIPSLLEKDCVISATVQEVFERFEDKYKWQGEITYDSLIALDSIFGETLERAFELVETDSVKFLHPNCLTAGVYQVHGNLHCYIIFPNINYCSCLSYKYHVVDGISIMCKHVLATVIAKILGKVELVQIGSSQFHNILLSSASVNEQALNKG